MNEPVIFHLAFDGEAIKDGSIEVNELAPALLALGELVDETNKYVTEGRAAVALRVRPELERGSFKIALEIAERCYDRFVDLFTSPGAAALAAFLGIIGISGGLGLIQIIKKSKGKKPKTVVEIEQTTRVRVEFEGKEPVEVERNVFNIFNNLRARDAVARVVKPLRGEGIDELQFYHKGNPTVAIAQDEADYFRAPDLHEEETVSETETILRIMAISFKEGNKWRFSDGGNTYYISLLDEDFINRIHRTEVRFGENDCLRVVLRTRQWYEGEDLKIAREILKVIEHIPSGTQTLIPFNGPENSDVKKQ